MNHKRRPGHDFLIECQQSGGPEKEAYIGEASEDERNARGIVTREGYGMESRHKDSEESGAESLALKQNRIASDSNAAKEAARRTFLPNSSSEPNFDKQSQSSAQAQLQSSARQAPQLRSKDSRFSFGEPENANSPTPPSFDFLPPINFDDFQTTISTYDSPKSKHQPPRSQLNPPPSIKASINSKPQPMTITQRESSVPNLSHLSAAPPNQLQTSASTSVLPVRARRGSQTGPGAPAITASGITARVTRKPMAPQPDKKQQSNLSRTPSLNANARKTQGSTPQPPNPDTSFAAPTRSSKAKSLQPLPRSATLTDLPQPEQRRSVNVKVTTRSKTPRTDTPSDKRKSGRMSGLGARTISPTDARRLRRMSTKQGPPSPSKELTHPRSPSATPRRPAMTPSSNRATPETSNRMAPPPNLNLSRTSSYQSLRAPSAGQGKIGQSASTSKLPTPKSRNLYSAAERRDDEEMVPPVPAIPKAYESPKDLVDIPFFSGLKTPLAGGMDNEGSALPIPTRRGESSTTPDSRQHQHRRGLTVGNGANSETPPAMPAVNKKTLQPLRLPPLNLLPLSTPTAARINSYPAPSQEVDARGTTPPFKRNAAKTPSTPMTASKATFYRRHDDEPSVPFNARSNSTQPGARVPRYEEPNNGVLLPPSSPGKRQAITPFTSGSLPKPSSKYSKPPRLPDEFTLGNHDVEPHASKPMGPRPRTVSKSVKETASINTVSSTEDQEQPPPSAATGLRRKLSLGWRKTPPKATTTSNAEPLKLQTKYDDMPPPKIPASATWSTDSPISGSSSGRPSFESTKLESHRSKPSVSSNNKMPHLESAPAAKPPMPSNIAVRQPQASAPPQGQRSTSWSILGSMNRTLGSKNTPPQPKPRTINALHLDKDDVAANDEMRRLSTKRRDIDVAARETEELRKRATQKERMTPAQAIQSSAGVLNIYEKGEIIDYKDGVWFCGSKQAKKHVGDISAAGTTNFGYDDERGDYNIVMGDHLGYRYEVIDVLGKGSFGQVVRCIDHKLGTLCAVKIIRNKKRFHQQALVEVNILQKLKEWDPDEANATLTITSSFYFRNHLCITSPSLSINLYEFIRTHNFSGFSIQLIRRFARQILACLCLLQSKRIIHCDLKPENILLCDPRRADVRVIDFGSSCKADEKVYTYIQSRFYRSPEVILGSDYGLGIDMWSFGCILAELFTGYPIFPGENEQEQLACIMEIFGPPARDIIEKASRRKLFFDSSLKPRVTVSSKGRRRRPSSKTLSGAIKCDDEAFLDFLSQCLRWDPEKRLRPDQAVSHPFITNEPLRRTGPVSSRTRNATSAASSTTTTASQSPVKRVHPTNPSLAAMPPQATASTPRARPLPDTPTTAARNGIATASNANNTMKPPSAMPQSAGRRQSLAPSLQQQPASAPPPQMPLNQAMAGSKRASNGALLAQHYQQQMASYGSLGVGGPSTTSSGLPRSVSGKLDLAGAAARESMGATARWR
ncbi:kinase-like protein [Aureobasidium pullulans]|uniref:dual-specificity kinase n=1 Tax=Aureobasidium pullulans TaxID=5580 RepID=A0A4V4KIW8_AURPU|nr:kinase-like protein [Aureobasidium pullulans]